MSGWYRWRGRTLELSVRVQPRASRDEIVGPHGEALKVRITAPPVEGRANEHLRRFLAKAFEVAPGRVELLAGSAGRQKRIAIHEPNALPAGIERPDEAPPRR